MQLTLPWRFGQKRPYSSIPRIDWSVPITQGLLYYGYDTGTGLVIDLVNSRRQNTVGTVDGPGKYAFGTGVAYNNDGTRYFAADTVLRVDFPSLSWACAYIQTGTVGQYTRPFGRTANNGGSEPFMVWDWEINPGGAGQNVVNANYCSSSTGAGHTTSGNWTGNANNVFTTLLTTIKPNPGGGSFVSSYAKGALWSSGSLAQYFNYSTNDAICFSGSSSAAAANAFIGTVYYGAFWNRTLTPGEAVMLHQNPYRFLIYPEDEVFAALVGVTTAPFTWSAMDEESAALSRGHWVREMIRHD